MADDGDKLTLAGAYADALLDLATAAGKVEGIAAELDGLAEVVRTQPDFAAFIGSPVIGAQAKRDSIARMFNGRVEDVTLRFLQVLADHERLELLPVMAEAYRLALDRRIGRVHVEVATATPLGDADREHLRARLGRQMGGEVVLHEEVRPDLIGGLVIRVGDTMFDGSVKQRLTHLREQIIARGTHEIQGGRNLLAD
ncbi:MAG: ATP synthase subunit delta [Phycisphaerae bacterium]|nr:ATP synthase subunit delta [Phycisphaerae bacterium]